MMRPEDKAKWAAALRSGEYKQGHMALMDYQGHYCCLGVLCKINGLTSSETGGEFNEFTYNGEVSSFFLPSNFRKEIGLSQEDADRLTKMNDGKITEDIEPHTFEQIADYIEQNPNI